MGRSKKKTKRRQRARRRATTEKPTREPLVPDAEGHGEGAPAGAADDLSETVAPADEGSKPARNRHGMGRRIRADAIKAVIGAIILFLVACFMPRG